MNIQTRKLNIIEAVLSINDKGVIEKIESLLKIEKTNQNDSEFNPMSIKEFHELIDRARQDKANGRVISHHDLKNRIKSWK